MMHEARLPDAPWSEHQHMASRQPAPQFRGFAGAIEEVRASNDLTDDIPHRRLQRLNANRAIIVRDSWIGERPSPICAKLGAVRHRANRVWCLGASVLLQDCCATQL